MEGLGGDHGNIAEITMQQMEMLEEVADKEK